MDNNLIGYKMVLEIRQQIEEQIEEKRKLFEEQYHTLVKEQIYVYLDEHQIPYTTDDMVSLWFDVIGENELDIKL
jgi:hypothetical protein